MLPVNIGAGMQLAEIGVHKVGLIEQVRLQPQAFVQLLGQQPLLDHQRAERLAIGVIQVVNHQLGEIRIVGPLQPL